MKNNLRKEIKEIIFRWAYPEKIDYVVEELETLFEKTFLSQVVRELEEVQKRIDFKFPYEADILIFVKWINDRLKSLKRY